MFNLIVPGDGLGSGRVGSGQIFCGQSRVGSGRVNALPGRVGSKKSDPWTTLGLHSTSV